MTKVLRLPSRHQVRQTLRRHLFPRSEAAEKAYNTVWGEKVPGHKRGAMLMELASLFEANKDELASIEAMGKLATGVPRRDSAHSPFSRRQRQGVRDRP